MRRLFLATSIGVLLLITLISPLLADSQSGQPPPSDTQQDELIDLFEHTAAITFTPVSTIYLPIVIAPNLDAPTISNAYYVLFSQNSPNCYYVDDHYGVYFNYTDPNGDGNYGHIHTVSVYSPSGETDTLDFSTVVFAPSDGYSGKAFFEFCNFFTYPDTKLDMTITLIDGAGNESDPLVITIPKP